MTVDEYFVRSRRLSVAMTFILPLLVGYEVGVLLTDAGVENAVARYLFKGPILSFFGADGFLVFNALLTAAFLLAYGLAEEGDGPLWDLYLPVLVESAAFAAVLGTVVLGVVRLFYSLPAGDPTSLSASILPHDTALAIVLSMGAGVYEEIFFRGVVLGGLLWLVREALREADGDDPHAEGGLCPRAEAHRWTWAALVALVGSSLLFAAAHHVGAHGEPFALRVFAFRYVSGVVLGVIYLWRGLGVAVYTHAFYDILIDLRHFV